jgi:LuxR family maltose regulon positive regulatory protein
MAALSMQRLDEHDEIAAFISAFSGSNRYIFDYLADEVLKQRPEGTGEFLLQTSILERMSGPLCDAVTGQQNSQVILEELDAANLFIIPLDDDRQWYRYHHLFADQLRHRQATLYPGRRAELHGQASQWYEKNQMPVEAIKHALNAGEQTRAAQIIEIEGRFWLARSELGLLLRWLTAMPEDLIRARPNLGLLQGWAMALINHFDKVEPVLQDAENAYHAALSNPDSLSDLGLSEPDERARFQGYVATCRAALARSRADTESAIALLHQALDLFPVEEQAGRGVATLYLGYALWMAGQTRPARQTFEQAKRTSLAGGQLLAAQSAMDALGKILLELGELNAGFKIHQQAMEMAAAHTERTGHQSPGVGLAHNGMAILHYEWNDLGRARVHAEKGIGLFEPWGVTENLLDSYGIMARIHQAEGDVKGARELADRTVSLVKDPSAPPWLQAKIESRRARLRIMPGPGHSPDTRFVERWAIEAGLNSEDDLNYQQEEEYIVLTRLMMAQGKNEQALTLLDRLQRQAEEGGRQGRLIEILLLTALALLESGLSDESMKTLENLLALSEPERYKRIFVDEGSAASRLLTQGVSYGIALRYVSDILSAFPSLPSSSADVRQPLVDPLSKREIEILQMMASGLTGPQIAGQLYLSYNTVKSHIKNIYGKLNVNNRAEAIERAQMIGLIR